MIAKTSNISDMDLELGIECIKTLSDIIIDKNDNLSKVEKEVRKRWLREFLDIWKKYVKYLMYFNPTIICPSKK